jgi:DNA-binding NtrC family response regulator
MSERPSALPAAAPRLICVDDDPGVLAALRRLLRREPYSVVTTSSPEEALRLLEDGIPTLVMTDLRMPGMDGEGLIREVQKRHPRTGRLMLTAYPEVAQALLRDLGEVFAKPWDDHELRAQLWERLRPRNEERADAGAAAPEDALSLLADFERALESGRDAAPGPSVP